MKVAKNVLPVIVLAQFACTSVWFAGNAVMKELTGIIQSNALGYLTSAVQFGFIAGTLCYSLLMIADRFSPSAVFCCSALAAALADVMIILPGQDLYSMVSLRFLTGFFLAGIYPVGMKITADHYKVPGKALAYLVGALVLGTAFPHLLRSMSMAMPWKYVIIVTAVLCALGGIIIFLFIPDGPYRVKGQGIHLGMLPRIFRNNNFISASLGYFGHMWELYTFWAFIPVIIETYKKLTGNTINTSLLSFLVIAIGGPACVIGGYLSKIYGPKKIASSALFLSGICCLLSPLFFLLPPAFFIIVLCAWGMAVIADSPMFSTLVARYANPEMKGTALTVVTCIGFSITIVSIQFLSWISGSMDPVYIYMLLAAGPLLGLMGLRERANGQ